MKYTLRIFFKFSNDENDVTILEWGKPMTERKALRKAHSIIALENKLQRKYHRPEAIEYTIYLIPIEEK